LRAAYCLAVALCAAAFSYSSALAAHSTSTRWVITKTEWTEEDEKGFGEFIRHIAESGCDTTVECMRGPANIYRGSDPKNLDFGADCAKWVYMLRAYYAWKNGLPFTFVDRISGSGADIRFNNSSNQSQSRRELTDHGHGIDAVAALRVVHDSVSTSTYRMDASKDGAVVPDFYSPKIEPGAIRPGTAIYDPNGHVVIVYEILRDGRIRYMDASPDHTVSRSIYGAQFGQGPVKWGGGFKNFRPVKLVGATKRQDGTYVGGHMVVPQNSAIPDFSLEQYQGNVADADGDGSGLFQYGGVAQGYFEYVRISMSGGKALDPIYELRTTVQSLCSDLQSRVNVVDLAIEKGVNKKPQPQLLPGNIYQTGDQIWEGHATPARDARLKNGFALLYQEITRYGQDRRLSSDRPSLKQELRDAYLAEANACSVTYTNSNGHPVTLSLPDIQERLFSIDFDPYHCIERRWGATREEELASCGDDDIKTRWYRAEQGLRNQAERNFYPRQNFTLAQLEQRTRGSGVDDPPPDDILEAIDNIDKAVVYAGMKPVGY
jgi:hypothetical protein